MSWVVTRTRLGPFSERCHRTEPSSTCVTPRSIAQGGRVVPEQSVRPGDSVIFFNYRGDRPREIIKAFVLPDEEWKEIQEGGFDRGERIDDLFFALIAIRDDALETFISVLDRPLHGWL